MEIETKIVGIVNQKGGAGKTTLTTLAANSVAMVFNKKIAVIDSDMQGSIIHKRKIEMAEGIKDFPYQVYYSKPAEIMTLLASLDGEYDYIFIDMPGQAYGEGLNKLLISLDYAFVPCTAGDTDVTSTLDFLKILKEVKLLKEKEDMFMKIFLINNKVDNTSRYKDMVNFFNVQIERSAGALEARDEHLSLRSRVIYPNMFSTCETAYGKGDDSFDNFINAFYEKIK